MKAFYFLLFLCAGLLLAGPAYAHGGDAHDKNASAAISADPVHEAPDKSADAAAGADSHDKAAGESESAKELGFFGFLKQLHPFTVHFPIALFLMAALTELFVMAGKGAGAEPAVRVLIYGGAAGGVVAALFGWIHTGLWFGGDTVMQLHRWNGMLILVLGLGLAGLVRRGQGSRSFLRAGLFAISALILLQGFLGGELARGPDHLGLSLI